MLPFLSLRGDGDQLVLLVILTLFRSFKDVVASSSATGSKIMAIYNVSSLLVEKKDKTCVKLPLVAVSRCGGCDYTGKMVNSFWLLLLQVSLLSDYLHNLSLTCTHFSCVFSHQPSVCHPQCLSSAQSDRDRRAELIIKPGNHYIC